MEATTGRLAAPESMRAWIEGAFGTVAAVEEQRVLRVTDRATLEGTLFNGLRAARPTDTRTELSDRELEEEISGTEGDPFCRPEEGTPADTFGRIRGRYCTTASNVAKYDALHGLVVFDDHDPLRLTPEKVEDYLEVGLRWGRRALEEDPEARYLFMMWNCLWRAGGSILHGHAQLTATRGMHYPAVERLRRAALGYAAEHGTNYFDDLHRAHEALGLSLRLSPEPDGTDGGVRGFVSLTPVKERELVLLGESLDRPELRRAVGEVLRAYVKDLGVRAFNVACLMPPLTPDGRTWEGFPALVRIVDRGDPASRTSDIGAMELYAAAVVAADPFRVAEELRAALSTGRGAGE